MQQIAWAGEKSYSSGNLADCGGKHGLPAKQYFTTSHNTKFNPVFKTLSDDYKSDKSNYLNNL
jgi:hypothetical protein